jgi:hypothetical protein
MEYAMSPLSGQGAILVDLLFGSLNEEGVEVISPPKLSETRWDFQGLMDA